MSPSEQSPSARRAGAFTAVLMMFVSSTGVSDLRAASTAPQGASIELGKASIALIRIPAGTFRMGTDEVIHADDHWKECPSCPSRNDSERPAHTVTIRRDFWMGQYPVTQGQWRAAMGRNPAQHQASGPAAPVEQVNWNDVQAFLAAVNAAQTRWTVRLPTEAEWEYAARAGSSVDPYGPLDRIAWYGGNSGNTTHPVGQKEPNAFGLHDMLGNVWQWCQDWYGPYPDSSEIDPQGPPTGDRHVTRGGCYYCPAIHERAARRNRDVVDHVSSNMGFRIVALPRTPGGGDTR